MKRRGFSITPGFEGEEDMPPLEYQPGYHSSDSEYEDEPRPVIRSGFARVSTSDRSYDSFTPSIIARMQTAQRKKERKMRTPKFSQKCSQTFFDIHDKDCNGSEEDDMLLSN